MFVILIKCCCFKCI